jgi:hypothetical protein
MGQLDASESIIENWLEQVLTPAELAHLRLMSSTYGSVASAATVLLKETIPHSRYDPRPMAAIDFLADQWPTDDVLSEKAFSDALWPRNWQTEHLGAILRAVAYFEFYLERIVESRLPVPGQLAVARRTFSEKVRLAAALGAIGPNLAKSFTIVAQIRNRFAHELGRQLQNREVQDLCSSLIGRPLMLFACYTGGSSKSPQRFRHALTVLFLTLKEIDAGQPGEYPWFDPTLATLRLGDRASQLDE